MIELSEVTKTYGPSPRRTQTVIALEGVTLQIPEGATWAVVGPNGAGKTTLFALILGFIHPSAGRVRIAGLAPRIYLRRHGAAFLPERFHLPGEWSITATLQALARLEGLRGTAARTRVEHALARFGLEPHAAKPLASLSRGLLQRVGLAQLLLSESRLIILDEPTEGLDPLWRIEFRDLLAELRRDGRTTLIASHDLAEVERVAENAVLLEDGRIREILPISHQPARRREYRLDLARPAPGIADIFPGATALEPAATPAGYQHADPGGATPSATGAEGDAGAPDADVVAYESYLVEVTDDAELSARLAALLATGATITAVVPVTKPLEQRVQRALSGCRP